MRKIIIVCCAITASVLIAPKMAKAQVCCGPYYYRAQREENALRDSARAQERQADSLRRMEQYEHERNLREDRQIRIENRDRRDNYRR